MIKMLDLTREYKKYENEYMNAIKEVLLSGNYILGKYVEGFENKLKEYFNVDYAIGVGNGTDALRISLLACDINKGDEIITTPFTFFATAEVIFEIGAIPVFVDIDLRTYNIDINRIQEKINDKTKAILPVHLYGNPCNMNKIMEIARAYNLRVIEDCAQSFGSSYNDKLTGTFGDCGAFSFYPTKNLGCAGDGGAIITNNEDIYEKIKMLRSHGAKKKYVHSILGFNSRLDSIQAKLLEIKIKYINKKNRRRREIAYLYNNLINDKYKKPVESGYHIYHQYTLYVENRDELKEYLKENNIQSAVHYPLPLHKQQAISKRIKYEKFENAENAAAHVISLPIYPELTDNEVKQVAGILNNFNA